MIQNDFRHSRLTISFKDKNVFDLQNYHDSILAILAKIELSSCDPELKEYLKVVYDLLAHFKLREDIYGTRDDNEMI